MLQLIDIIRERVVAQGMHLPSATSSDAILIRAIWVFGKYGLVARGSSQKNPEKSLGKLSTLKLKIETANRIVSSSYYVRYIHQVRKEPLDLELVDTVMQNSIAKPELARALDLSSRKLSPRITKEVKRGNLIETGEGLICYWKTYAEKFHPDIIDLSPQIIGKDMILHVLQRYPFLTINQLELMTGIDTYRLSNLLHSLAKDGQISRGLTRTDAPDEIFVLKDHKRSETVWDSAPVFVLEKRDAMVDLLKLERFLRYKDRQYWIFIHGVPQAEFDLASRKKTRSQKEFNLEQFNQLPTSTLGIPEIINHIEQWGISNKLTIKISKQTDPLSKMAGKLVQFLFKRGYQIQKDELVLRMSRSPVHQDYSSLSQTIYSKTELGAWYRERQFLSPSATSSQEVLKRLIQLNDSYSIAYRCNQLPENVEDLEEPSVVYFSGIGNQLGYVSHEWIKTVMGSFPKLGKMGIVDGKIMSLFEQEPNRIWDTDDLRKELGLHEPIKNRLFYLEQIRRIKRSGNYDPSLCKWAYFHPKPDPKHKNLPSTIALGDLIVQVLSIHIPLSLAQLSRYLEIGHKTMQEQLNVLIKRGKILEGYYLANVDNVQYTIPSVLDAIDEFLSNPDEETSTSSAISRVDILPLSDPLTTLHLPPLMLDHSYLQISQRFPDGTFWYSVFWDGYIIGYFLKIPDRQTDFRIVIRLVERAVNNEILSGLIQKMANIFRMWYHEEIRIDNINGTEIRDQRFELLHFIIETLGLNL